MKHSRDRSQTASSSYKSVPELQQEIARLEKQIAQLNAANQEGREKKKSKKKQLFPSPLKFLKVLRGLNTDIRNHIQRGNSGIHTPLQSSDDREHEEKNEDQITIDLQQVFQQHQQLLQKLTEKFDRNSRDMDELHTLVKQVVKPPSKWRYIVPILGLLISSGLTLLGALILVHQSGYFKGAKAEKFFEYLEFGIGGAISSLGSGLFGLAASVGDFFQVYNRRNNVERVTREIELSEGLSGVSDTEDDLIMESRDNVPLLPKSTM